MRDTKIMKIKVWKFKKLNGNQIYIKFKINL